MFHHPRKTAAAFLVAMTVAACSAQPPAAPAPAAPAPDRDAFMSIQTTWTRSSGAESASGDALHLPKGQYHVKAQCTGDGAAVVETRRADLGENSTDHAPLTCPGDVSMPSFPASGSTVVTVTLRGKKGSIGLMGEVVRD